MATFERFWSGRDGDDGSVHVLGNGQLCAYGRGPDLFQLIGPPYSGPQWGSLEIADTDGISCRSSREPGTAIWTHRLADAQGELAVLTDWVDSRHPCCVRHFVCFRPLRLRYTAGSRQTRTDDSAILALHGAAGSRSLWMPRGQRFYGPYPITDHGHASLFGTGPVQMQDESETALLLTLGPGEGCICFAASPDWRSQVLAVEDMLATPWGVSLERTRAMWLAFSAAGYALPESGEAIDAERLAWAADSVAVQIKAQQGLDGGVMAGHNYHLAYVRDQYGVFRGLLELGHHTEARAILEYYWRIFSRCGAIHNAQPIGGTNDIFHIHEEDRSEITGYLINQAFDWLAATGDGDLVEKMQPMLDWALDAQMSCLVDGMLPFNGDETYVAGGILPRSCLRHGSAEATLLFLESGQRFQNWAQRQGRWPSRRAATIQAALGEVASRFRANFMQGGLLYANQPSCAEIAPRFRHGVCQRPGCRSGQLMWLQRDPHGNYQCVECFAQGPLPLVAAQRHYIASVALAPAFVGSGPLSAAECNQQIQSVCARWLATGQLPSQADDAGGSTATVGYDYGFLLMGLDRIRHPRAVDLAVQTLGLADATGVWVEYYDLAGKGFNTRCRPWESAINILAILQHLKHFANNHPQITS